MSYAIHEAISVALLSALDKDSYLNVYLWGYFSPIFGILVPINFRNSGKMPLILVREFWNLVIEKSVKSQGILLFMICGNPVYGLVSSGRLEKPGIEPVIPGLQGDIATAPQRLL